MQTDMTVGKPMKMILDFTIPVFIGNVFQQFYNMADAIIVGKFVGTKGLAAVGSTGTIMFLIIGFLTGLTAGTVLTGSAIACCLALLIFIAFPGFLRNVFLLSHPFCYLSGALGHGQTAFTRLA